MLIDTHCHIHESDYPLDKDEAINRAHQAGVMQMICVGTNTADSRLALDFASKHDGVFASVGVHPHYANDGIDELKRFVDLFYSRESLQPRSEKAPGSLLDPARSRSPNKQSQQIVGGFMRKLVAIGEIGLDYHYQDDPSPDMQMKILKQQIELALEHDLPIIFHVREAYDDFWKVLDSFRDDSREIRGVLHSFTDTLENAKEGLRRGFYISVNGISTFTHDKDQKKMFESIPLDKLLLETDAPWLTPYPLRGKIKENEPAFVREIAEYTSQTRHISFEEIAGITTANALRLFNL
jgi:TatD DNase family protein